MARSIGMVLLVLGAVVATTPAAAVAGTGGYPYAQYHGPGTNPAAYEWTDRHGNPISPYGYYFRNCTDFAAWKLATTNKFGDYRGLRNGGEWGTHAKERHYKVNMSPKPGSIAWWSPTGGLGRWGHVAWVQAVNGNSVTIQEYNYRVPSHPGTWDRRTISRTAVSGYIHFKDLQGGATSNNDPRGHVDKVGSPGAGQVRVAGWAFDPNAKTKPATIHVYVGGKAGAKGAKGYNLGEANMSRSDVARAFKGVGSRHGFDKVLRTGKHGKQKVCIYAINRGPGHNVLLDCRAVAIKAGTTRSVPCSTSRGDGVGAYFPWDGTWHLRNCLSPGSSNYAFKRGRDGIIPVVGDWDGDGRDSIGAYFPWDGTWHLRNSLSAGPSDYAFKRGRDGIIPVVGNWDGA